MKRNKFSLFLKKIALITGISFAAFTGCKTVPQVSLNPVQTVDILDDEGAMYIHIPSKENQEFLELLVSGFYKGLSESDAKLLVSKLNNVYASFGSRKEKKRIQLALDGELPGITSSLLKKNGYSEKSYVAKSLYENLSDSFSTYRYYESSELQIAVPSSNQMVIGKNVSSMLDQFNMERDAVNQLGENITDVELPYRGDWKSTVLYQWISEDVPTIHFYIVRPQAFLTNLIGTDVSSKVFQLMYAKGNFAKLPNNKYELTLELDFKDKKYVKPAMSILILTLGLTDSEMEQTSPNHVVLKGIHLNTKQLVRMLGI